MNNQLDRTLFTSIVLGFFTSSLIISKKLNSELLDLLEEVGKSSEEIFRGERLPLLKPTFSIFQDETKISTK